MLKRAWMTSRATLRGAWVREPHHRCPPEEAPSYDVSTDAQQLGTEEDMQGRRGGAAGDTEAGEEEDPWCFLSMDEGGVADSDAGNGSPLGLGRRAAAH